MLAKQRLRVVCCGGPLLRVVFVRNRVRVRQREEGS